MPLSSDWRWWSTISALEWLPSDPVPCRMAGGAMEETRNWIRKFEWKTRAVVTQSIKLYY